MIERNLGVSTLKIALQEGIYQQERPAKDAERSTLSHLA